MSHMKGPWEWAGSDLNGINEKGEIDSVIFCTVEYDDGNYAELYCEKEDRVLIAAAPDLETALLQIIEVCGTANYSNFNQIKDAVTGSLEIAEAAIEKMKVKP